MTSKELQTLKYQRLPELEKIIFESFKGLKEYTDENNLDFIYYKSEHDVLYCYNQKTSHLGYCNLLIGSKIRTYFDGDYQKEKEFVRNKAENCLKLKIITTSALDWNTFWLVKKNLKLKAFTINNLV